MLAPGTIIGGVRIEQLLGRGGMGEVYKAEQLSLKRPVAVKRIAEHLLDNAHAIARFEREALIVAKIHNPHVVHVYDFGRFEDELHRAHYLLIMELIQDGRSLSSLLGTALDWRLATSLIMQTAEGLAAAAELGVVHRDIKPENIMLTHKGIAKLGDFGLARSVDSTSVSLGSLVGTPDYMAPEACRGDVVDSRSDIYSLGCTWYELLCGRTPFHDAINVMAVLHCHIAEQPKDIRSFGLDIPEPICALVHRCLAKEPNQRPSSPQQLIADIMALAADGIVIAHTVPTLLPMRPASATDPTTSLTDIAAPNGINAATAPTVVNEPKPETTATGKSRKLGLSAAVVLLIAAGLSGWFLLHSDPFISKREAVASLRRRGELDLAMQQAQALVAEFSGNAGALDEVRDTLQAQLKKLEEAGRFDDALKSIDQYRSRYPQIADDAERLVRLDHAAELAHNQSFDEAAKIYAGLRTTYPRDVDICRTILHLMRGHETDYLVVGAVTALIKNGEGPIEPEASTFALAALRYLNPDGSFAPSLRKEMSRRQPSLALELKDALLDESDTLRINAHEFLRESGNLQADEDLRYQLYNLTRSKRDFLLDEAIEYFTKNASGPDWNERKKRAGVAAIDSMPCMADLWSDRRDLVCDVLVKSFLPQISDALPKWAFDDKEGMREAAWSMLKQAKLVDRVDEWKFHANTLDKLDALHDSQAYYDALRYFGDKAKTVDAAKALAVIETCHDRVDKQVKQCEERLPLHAPEARKRLQEIDEVMAKLRTGP